MTNVAFVLSPLPDAVTLLNAFDPLTIVHLSVGPRIDTFTLRFAVLVLALVKVAGAEQLVTPTIAFIIVPFTLIDAARMVDKDAEPVPLFRVRMQLSSEKRVSVLLEPKCLGLPNLFVIKLIRYHLVLLYLIVVIFKLTLFTRRSKAFGCHHLSNQP